MLNSLYIYNGVLDEDVCQALQELKETVRMADFIFVSVGKYAGLKPDYDSASLRAL